MTNDIVFCKNSGAIEIQTDVTDKQRADVFLSTSSAAIEYLHSRSIVRAQSGPHWAALRRSNS